jgi:hypothetical protein
MEAGLPTSTITYLAARIALMRFHVPAAGREAGIVAKTVSVEFPCVSGEGRPRAKGFMKEYEANSRKEMPRRMGDERESKDGKRSYAPGPDAR